MTRDELIVAAKAARTYPEENGLDWGYGPLADWDAARAAEEVDKDPTLAKYG